MAAERVDGQALPRPLPQAGGEKGAPPLPQAGGEAPIADDGQALPRPLPLAGGEGVCRVQGGRNREVQVVRTPNRKLFDRARKDLFLDWFAATCNMGWAAEKAGISYKTVSKHVHKDPDFRAEMEEAMRAGVLRVKAISLQTSKPEGGAADEEEDEADAPPPDIDRDQAIRLMREHERTLALGRKPGRMPRVATNAEVREALTKALIAFGVRVAAEEGEGAEASGAVSDGGAA